MDMETVSGYKAYGVTIREGDKISGIIATHDKTGAFAGSKGIRGKVVRTVTYTVDGVELREMRNKKITVKNQRPGRYYVRYGEK